MHKKESKANSHQHTNKQAWAMPKSHTPRKKTKKENKIKQYGAQKPA